ncbi:uncharacterized protein LOC126908451 [Daktulosphaira vitifoliae]|uniref:uncharacterized protein LOC126908451 n=1 Tax=Daktulosphaira vitifoliae TaxID=58002 RepID=UPI0021A9E63D|nr:uncharacterized protein LOC126908451 [Daktulosphaira vitifoliae]
MTIFSFLPLLIFPYIGQCVVIEYLRDENNLQIVYDDLMKIDFGIPQIDHLKKIAASPKNSDKMTRNDLLTQAIQSRVKDLECGIKIMALSVMLGTEIQINHIKSLEKKKWIYIPLLMMYYEPIFCQTAYQMLRILYNMGLKDILDIWMFTMLYCECPYSLDVRILPDLMKARELIYQELKKSTMNCNVKSTHDITNPQHLLNIEYKILNSCLLKSLTKVYIFERKVFDEVTSALSIYAESNIIIKNRDKFCVNNLYLRHDDKLSLYKNDAIGYLQKNYGYGIQWGNAINIIETSMEETMGVEKFFNRFYNIKILHTQFLAQMNIIFSRLIAIHILMVYDKITNKKNIFISEVGMEDFVLDANYKIIQKIDLFTSLTGYSRNKYFANLKEYFSYDVYAFCDYKDFQLNIIKSQLKDLCLMFGNECNATKTLETNSISFFDDLKKSYQNVVETVLIEKPSLVGDEDEFIIVDNTYCVYKIVDTFVKHLSFILENVDYDIINKIL